MSTACKEAKDLVGAGLFSPEEFALVLALRGISVAYTLPHAFHRRARRGTLVLRHAAPRRRAPQGCGPPGPLRHRALHEALLPHRQGRRRPHRHRLCRHGSARDHAAPAARPLSRAFPPQAHARSRGAGLRRRERPPDARVGRMSSRRIRSTSSACSGLPTSTTSPSIPRPSTSSPVR